MRKNDTKPGSEDDGEVRGRQGDRDGLADGALNPSAPCEEGLIGDEVNSRYGPQQVVDAQVDVPVIRRRLQEDRTFISKSDIAEMNSWKCGGLEGKATSSSERGAMGIEDVHREAQDAEVAEDPCRDAVVRQAVELAERPLQGRVEGSRQGDQLPEVAEER